MPNKPSSYQDVPLDLLAPLDLDKVKSEQAHHPFLGFSDDLTRIFGLNNFHAQQIRSYITKDDLKFKQIAFFASTLEQKVNALKSLQDSHDRLVLVLQ